MGKLLALDVGIKRVGVALSDSEHLTVSPLDTFDRAQNRALQKILDLIEAEEIDEIVIGMPLNGKGEETEQCADVTQFGHRLSRRTEVPVVYYDEFLSSVSAKEIMGVEKPNQEVRKKGVIDALAASIVLQEYIKSKKQL